MYITFQNPSYLAFLFLIPLLIFFHFYTIKNLRGKALRFANFEAIARIRGIDLYSKNIIPLIINILIITSIIFSLAGLTLHREVESSSFSYVIAIDSSESMGANDFEPDRLSAAKKSAIDFVEALPPHTKIGITSFAANTLVEKKLTDDKDSLKFSINKIELTNIGGTDIFEAYKTSALLLEKEENKAIIIISDGQINVGNTEEVIKEALNDGVIIHTMGIGTQTGGNTRFGISKIDEDSLKSLAYNTKGKYFNATSEEQMKNSFREIIPLTKRIAATNLSPHLMILTMVLFIISQFLNQTTKISI